MTTLNTIALYRDTAISRALWANVIAGMIGGGLVATPAFAQPEKPAASSSGIEEVIVTARRVQENLQRVPVAVSAVSAEALQQKSITTIGDLSRAVPGFTSQASYQANAPVYSIRAQKGDTNPTPNTEGAVQVYFAEMNTSRAIGTTGSFFDIDSVQVLKGPQGTLFGRNSTGGAILITPKAPQDTFGGYVQGSYGNFDYRDFEGVLNIPYDEKVALRVGGKMTKRDGYIENVLTGESGTSIDEASGRVSLQLKPNDAVKSTFIGTYYWGKHDGNTFKLSKIEPVFFNGLGLTPGLQADIAALAALGPYKVKSSVPVYSHDRVASIQNNTEIALNDNLTFKNIVGYRETTSNGSSDFTAGFLGDLFASTNYSKSKLMTEEIQLQGKHKNFDFVVGGYLLHEEVKPLDATSTIFRALGAVLPAALPSRTRNSNDHSTSSYSGFAHGSYDLSSVIDGLSVSGGVRLTYDIKKVTYRNISSPGTPEGRNGYTCFSNGLTFSFLNYNACNRYDRRTSTELTYDVSVNYQLNPDTLVYVAHRHGYKAGGFDIQTILPSPTGYAPEFVDDFELGVKSDFNIGGMPTRLNVAGYYQIYKDIQHLIAIPLPATNSVTNSTINIAKANVDGAEMELTMKPTSAVELTATYAYTHPKTKEWLLPQPGGFPPLDVSDSHFNYVAEHQWSLTGRYTLPVPVKLGEVSLSATWYGQSKMFAPDNTTARCGVASSTVNICLGRNVVIPEYDLLNLRADWKNVGGNNVDLGLFATNVTNKVYTSSILGLNGVLGTQADQIGAPRMYGVTLRVPFGGEAN